MSEFFIVRNAARRKEHESDAIVLLSVCWPVCWGRA
jgi:hypothetical protein